MLSRIQFNSLEPKRLAISSIGRKRFLDTAAFSKVLKGSPDPMQDLNRVTDADTNPRKVDLGAGVYRSEDGGYHEFKTLAKVRFQIFTPDNLRASKY